LSQEQPFNELTNRWRSEAEMLSGYGCSSLAETCRMHADELEQAWEHWWQDAYVERLIDR